MNKRTFSWVLFSTFMLNGCATERVVGFQSEITPILREKCQQCHLPPEGQGYVLTGLSMESYDTLMNGTVYGKVIIPGDSKRSVFNKLIEGRAGESMKMPHGNSPGLSDEEIKILKSWVNQGALNN